MLSQEKLNAIIRVFSHKAAEHETKARVAMQTGEVSRYLRHLDLAKAHHRQIEDFRLRIVLLNNSPKKVLQTAG